jgi:probable F420-dependent oxidoreductase
MPQKQEYVAGTSMTFGGTEMHIGTFVPIIPGYATPSFIAEAARTAEQAGFHSIWAPEHVLLFDEYESRYPYSDDGRLRIGPEGGVLEPFGLLSFIAACTSRIRLGTGICLVPQRNPVYTAKDVATLDYLSDGRVDFGVGIGWLQEEFAALDVPWPRRAQRTHAYLEVMQRLWSDPLSSYAGEFYRLPPSRQFPKPVQKPHPPIHVGGESDAALRRTADIGQGWYGYGLTPPQAAERVQRLADMLRERGRSPDDVLVSIAPNTRDLDIAAVEEYRRAGVHQLNVAARGRTPEAYLDFLKQLGRDIVEPAMAL